MSHGESPGDQGLGSAEGNPVTHAPIADSNDVKSACPPTSVCDTFTIRHSVESLRDGAQCQRAAILGQPGGSGN